MQAVSSINPDNEGAPMNDVRLSALEAQLATALKDLDQMKAVEAIRDAVL